MPLITNYQSKLVTIPVRLPANQNLSEPVDTFGATICGISVPIYSFTGTSPIEMGFYVSTAGINEPYQLLVDSTGSPTSAIGVKFSAGGNVLVEVSPVLYLPVQYLKLYLYQIQPDDVIFNLVVSPVLQ